MFRGATIVLVGCLALASSSSHSDAKPARPTPTAYTAKDVACDRDRSSMDAKSTIEQVGGLVASIYD